MGTDKYLLLLIPVIVSLVQVALILAQLVQKKSERKNGGSSAGIAPKCIAHGEKLVQIDEKIKSCEEKIKQEGDLLAESRADRQALRISYNNLDLRITRIEEQMRKRRDAD